MPSETHDPNYQRMQWKLRFIDLRPPYLHIHSIPDRDAINAINLSRARIDHDPDFKRLLGGVSDDEHQHQLLDKGGHKRSGSTDLNHGLPHVFAVYGEQNTFLFAARSERAKAEWILNIDQGCLREEEDEEDGDDEVVSMGRS